MSCNSAKNTECKVGKAKYFQGEDMTIQEHQSGEGTQRAPQDIGEPAKPPDKSRRSFSKSGLVASGVLLTLSSRPVLGASVCVSPSGFISGNTSTHGDLPVCAGVSAESYWLGIIRNTNLDVQFSAMFPSVSNTAFYKNKLLSFIMTTPWPYHPQSPFEPTPTLLKHLVVAILNARSGKTPFLTEATIKSIFDEWRASGRFSPTAGVTWEASQIINYLSQTQNT